MDLLLDRGTEAKLNNVDLPWVVKGTHLGHELHQSCTMDFDSK